VQTGAPPPIRFAWSGWNSPGARYRAAMRLRGELEEFLRDSPQSQFLLIGHSHGGTIAIRAVDCDILRDRSFVACLSTPFLEALPRGLPLLTYTQVVFALALFMTSAAFYLAFGIVESHSSLHFLKLVPMRLYAVVLALVAGMLFLPLNIAKDRLFQKALWTSTQVQHNPEIAAYRVRLFRTTGDEASSWIAVFQVLSWLSSKCAALYVSAWSAMARRVASISDRLQDFGGDYSMLIGMAVALTLVLWVTIEASSEGGVAWAGYLLWIPAGIFIIGVFLVALYYIGAYMEVTDPTSLFGVFLSPILLLLLPISLLFAIFGLLGFGVGTAVLVLFFELSVEATPVGSWSITVLSPMRATTIRHSQIYENSVAIDHLCSWAKEITGSSPESS
jgi:hypothetical protein